MYYGEIVKVDSNRIHVTWDDLSTSIHRPNDLRVFKTRPKTRFKVGDWIQASQSLIARCDWPNQDWRGQVTKIDPNGFHNIKWNDGSMTKCLISDLIEPQVRLPPYPPKGASFGTWPAVTMHFKPYNFGDPNTCQVKIDPPTNNIRRMQIKYNDRGRVLICEGEEVKPNEFHMCRLDIDSDMELLLNGSILEGKWIESIRGTWSNGAFERTCRIDLDSRMGREM